MPEYVIGRPRPGKLERWPIIIDKPQPSRVDPIIADQLLKQFVNYGEQFKQKSLQGAEYLTDSFSGTIDKPGQSFIRNKALEDLSTVILPKRIVKSLAEIGEGRIPLTQPAPGQGGGLGSGEEGQIQRETEQRRALNAALDEAADLTRAVAVSAARYTAALQRIDQSLAAGGVSNLVADEIAPVLPVWQADP